MPPMNVPNDDSPASRQPNKVAITGSSGLIGTALIDALNARGHEAIRIVRTRPTGNEIAWDPASGSIDRARLIGVDAVVNLAGPGIGDHRWTAKYKRELRDTRINATKLIAETLAMTDGGPRTLISASGVNYYGESDTATFDEWSPPGAGFLARLCVDWEGSTAAAKHAGVRVATMRTGIVLSSHGGALAKMLPLFKLGFGGRFGSGRQWQSWISIDDHVASIIHLIEGSMSGPVNSTSPSPVTNREFTATLGHVLKRPAVLPVPRSGPALLFGRELVDTLLYSGQHARAQGAGTRRIRVPACDAGISAPLGTRAELEPNRRTLNQYSGHVISPFRSDPNIDGIRPSGRRHHHDRRPAALRALGPQVLNKPLNHLGGPSCRARRGC